MVTAIFVIFNQYGYFDYYIDYLANSIIEVADRLIIMVNGSIQPECYERLSRITSEILIRENIGYDAGAYKDTILSYLHKEDIEKCEKLILMNDTFYGPFRPWKTIFEKMEDDNIDYWGLSSYFTDYCGKPDIINNKWPKHVQGYFLVIKKQILNDIAFVQFWEELEYPEDYWSCVREFEVGISQYFERIGYVGSSYIEKNIPIFKEKKDSVQYMSFTEELVKDNGFPVVKTKSLSPLFPQKIDSILAYIDTDTLYPVQLIKEHIKMLDRLNLSQFLSIRELKIFVDNHAELYIYGYGKLAHIMSDLFAYHNWIFKGYIVTNNVHKDNRVISINEFKANERTGVVLALNKKNREEVFPIISGIVNPENIFVLGN